jgi:3-hydroxyisobutyrate dehydrogenase-like beta-hydroxyacid dehydrogenase
MARNARHNAGVIGLGIIGSRVAANLRRAGHQVWVWNRSPRPEPNFLSSPAEVAESAKVIQIFVSDGTALLETIIALAPALGPEHVIVNHATVSPKETLEAARLVQDREAKFLDAPFTGSRDAAEAGQLVFLIGGDEVTLAKARPQLEVNAKSIITIGDVGQATAMKVATNLMSAVAIGALAEGLALLDRSKVPLTKMQEVLEQHGARSPLADMKLPGMISGDFDPRFTLKNMFKDIKIALAMAEESGLDLPEAEAFAGVAMAGIQKGWADADYSAIARHFGYPGSDPKVTPIASSGEKKNNEGLLRNLVPFLPRK